MPPRKKAKQEEEPAADPAPAPRQAVEATADELECSICFHVMTNPVTLAATGQKYDLHCIRVSVEGDDCTDPPHDCKPPFNPAACRAGSRNVETRATTPPAPRPRRVSSRPRPLSPTTHSGVCVSDSWYVATRLHPWSLPLPATLTDPLPLPCCRLPTPRTD